MTHDKTAVSLCEIPHLSITSKMPCYSFSLPALTTCPTGRELIKSPDSPCHHCYGLKGRAVFPVVKEKKFRNFVLFQDLKNFVAVLSDEITKANCPLFRWQDCGDIISLAHLEAINQICINTPKIHHWLPTMEAEIVKRFLSDNQNFAENLTVRLSSKKVDRVPGYKWQFSSMIAKKRLLKNFNSKKYFVCQAKQWGGKCWSCTACWNFQGIIVYPIH